MSDDRQLRIEVGYGLEGQVTDAIASRIINDVIAPRIQAGDRDGAVIAGLEAIVGTIGGQGFSDSTPSVPPREPVGDGGRLSTPRLIIYGVIGVLFLILLITHPSLALFLLVNILSGNQRSNSRGGWGGGGFSGGGGRSGGGGASGSW